MFINVTGQEIEGILDSFSHKNLIISQKVFRYVSIYF